MGKKRIYLLGIIWSVINVLTRTPIDSETQKSKIRLYAIQLCRQCTCSERFVLTQTDDSVAAGKYMGTVVHLSQSIEEGDGVQCFIREQKRVDACRIGCRPAALMHD